MPAYVRCRSSLACTGTTTALALRVCRALREILRGLTWAQPASLCGLRAPPDERRAVHGGYDGTAGGLASACRFAQPLLSLPPFRQGRPAPDHPLLQCRYGNVARWQKPSQKPADTKARTGRQKHPARIPLFLSL